MKIQRIIIFLLAILMFNIARGNEGLSPEEILRKVDSVMNAPNDQYMIIEMSLIDRGGNKTIRKIEIYQKGSNKRLGKFISPAEYKGIGFLSLPKGVFYIYLPAFKKIKRISSNVKNSKFAGTDFTYEDMEPKDYEKNWQGSIIDEDSLYYKLKIFPKTGIKSDYKYIILTVRKDIYYPVKSEYFKSNDNLVKIMTADSLSRINGYWIATVSKMKDLRSRHTSIMKLKDIKLNMGLSNSIFTKRFLKQ